MELSHDAFGLNIVKFYCFIAASCEQPVLSQMEAETSDGSEVWLACVEHFKRGIKKRQFSIFGDRSEKLVIGGKLHGIDCVAMFPQYFDDLPGASIPYDKGSCIFMLGLA